MVTIMSMFTLASPILAQERDKSLLGELDSSMAKNKALSLPCTSTDFSLKLFGQLAQTSKDNVVISPFSAYAALSMALNGAAGSTSEQMAKAMGITANTIDSLNERNKAILVSLGNSDKKVQLEIGNAIFSDVSTPYKKLYQSMQTNVRR